MLLLSHVSAEQINLANSSFETGIGGTQGVAESGWFTFLSGSIASGVDITGFWNMSNADGPNAAYATASAANSPGGMFYQTVELDAGVTYEFTAAVGMSASAAKNDGNFSLLIYDNGFGNLLTSGSGTITTRGSFTDYTITYSATTTALYHVGVRTTGFVENSGGNTNQTTIFYDNVRLVAVPEPASFTLIAGALAGATLLTRRRIRLK